MPRRFASFQIDFLLSQMTLARSNVGAEPILSSFECQHGAIDQRRIVKTSAKAPNDAAL